MPNRILKETICTSENMDGLSPLAECLWYRLLVQFDDFGRFDGRPVVILARCFPLRVDKVKAKDVTGWLAELIAARLIRPYSVDGHDYILAVTWDKHQQVRAQRSKYPEPLADDDALLADDITCKQPLADDGICPRNPIQSNPNPNPNPNPNRAGASAPAGKPASPILPPAAQVFEDNGGKWAKGTLQDGTPKKDRAIAWITERVADTPDSLALWAKVVAGYSAQWSAYSYTVMVNDYYLNGRIPGEARPSSGSNGHGPPRENAALAAVRIRQAEDARNGNYQGNSRGLDGADDGISLFWPERPGQAEGPARVSADVEAVRADAV
jgi:hypothetical protein